MPRGLADLSEKGTYPMSSRVGGKQRDVLGQAGWARNLPKHRYTHVSIHKDFATTGCVHSTLVPRGLSEDPLRFLSLSPSTPMVPFCQLALS